MPLASPTDGSPPTHSDATAVAANGPGDTTTARGAERDPVPLTILGGYLGAGKTTLLNHLLRHAGGRRIAVVVNDFGTVNIDADLVEARDEQAISLAGGCVCCGFGDDLLDTLRSLRDAPQPFDHIVIETSGVALPANLRATVSLLQGVRVAATFVLADAESVRRQAVDRYVGETVREQLRAADLLLLTKGDLLHDDQVDATETWLRGQTTAPVLRAVMGAVPPAILLGAPDDLRATSGDLRGDRSATALSPERPVDGRESGAASGRLRASGGTLRPPVHVTAHFDTDAFAIDAPVDAGRLAAALAALTPPLARAKGMVPAADGRLQIVQIVGRRGSAEPAPANLTGPGRLVAISAGGPLDRDAVRAAIDAATLSGAPGPEPCRATGVTSDPERRARGNPAPSAA